MAHISIIIPVYNAGMKIKSCLRSIRKQTFQDYEVLIVDDGSTDKSGQICDQFAAGDSRLKVIHQKNQGSIAARRTGLHYAAGEYCCFCDADDRMLADALEVLHRSIKDADICIGNSVRLWRNVRIKNSYTALCFQTNQPVFYNQQAFTENMLCSWFGISNVPVGLCGKLFRTDLLRKAYDKTPDAVHFFGDDLVVTLNTSVLAKKTCFIPDIIYEYRIGGGTSKYNPHMLEDWLALYRYKKTFIGLYPMKQNAQVLMDIELCNMMMTYFRMLKQSQRFSEDELRRYINDTIQIPEVRSAAQNPDIPSGEYCNVTMLRDRESERILAELESEFQRNKFKQTIHNMLRRLA